MRCFYMGRRITLRTPKKFYSNMTEELELICFQFLNFVLHKCFYYVWQQTSNGLVLCISFTGCTIPQGLFCFLSSYRHQMFSCWLTQALDGHYGMAKLANVYSEISGKMFESSPFCSSLFNLLAVYCFISPGTFRNLELTIKKKSTFFSW